jgi:hypothetical protein
MPPAWVHRNGAPLAGKDAVVDQPTTRLLSSIPAATEMVLPGRLPRSMA